MGDNKKQKKQYKGPSHPWQKERIVEEKELIREFGLKNKKEIWKAQSQLRRYTAIAKSMVTENSNHAENKKADILMRLKKYKLVGSEGSLDDVLSLDVRNFLERRLQTIVLKKGFARTMKQARQFIIHRHIMVGNEKVTVPSYMVSEEEENQISFSPYSELHNADHPERVPKDIVGDKKETAEDAKEEKKKPKAKSEKKPAKAKTETKEEKKAEVKEEKKAEKSEGEQ